MGVINIPILPNFSKKARVHVIKAEAYYVQKTKL